MEQNAPDTTQTPSLIPPPAAAPPPRAEEDAALVPGTAALLDEVRCRLAVGESFDNRSMWQLAGEFLAGSRSEGTYDARYVYDVFEAAANLVLLEDRAAVLLSMSNPVLALETNLRPLLAQMPRQTDRSDEQVKFQQFSTPPTLAFAAAYVLAPRPWDVVMESSAGTGSLAVWPRAVGARVLTNEVSPRRLALLRLLGFDPTDLDGEFLHNLLDPLVRPTAGLINPPYSSTGGRVAHNRTIFGAHHVETLLKRIARGGRLAAIVGRGMAIDRPAFSAWWRHVLDRYNVRANLGLSGEEFARYGTEFDFQLLVIDKTGPTPGETVREQLRNVRHGRAQTLEEALAMLRDVAEDRPDPRDFAAAAVEPEADEPPSLAPLLTSDGAAEEHEAEPLAAEAEVVEDLPPAAAATAEGAEQNAAPAPDESRRSTEGGEMYVPYVTRKLKGGVEHPADIVEAATMAAVDPPDIYYTPCLQPEVISEGRLSRIQLEAVIYAGQSHERRLGNGARSGFFIGHGTGVGKGRIQAGIVLDNWNQGRRRAVWLSVSSNLIEASRADLEDLGARVPLQKLNDYNADSDITLPEGVIFCTYPTLISKSKKGRKRLDQLIEWLGPDGLILIDECHKAKNALATGRGEPTQTGKAVIDLQDPELHPDFRVVYSSATGAQDVRNLAYATRLGLWSDGTSFANFGAFMAQIEAGGMGAMELVCRDMKALGMYVSGSISFGVDAKSGLAVEYREVFHELTPEQHEMYDAAAKAWQHVLKQFGEALKMTNAGNKQRGKSLQGFWGRHQRFFRLLIAAFKVPTVIAVTEQALAEGRSPIISLIGTGEARTKEQVNLAVAQGGLLEDLDFSPREILSEAVMSCFPTVVYMDETDELSGNTVKTPLTKDGEIVHDQDALALRQEILDGLSLLDLPENPLDELVNHFGAGAVAELTGRKRRLIRNKATGGVEYKKRAPDGVAMTKVNLYEMDQFQNGNRIDSHKRIAIISDAASTGISLHASNRAFNRQRREVITLELSWSADRQLQTFGRAHRSDQAWPPIYTLISTTLGGERRFSSTIARRLGSLGALTKGDRSAVDGGDLAKYNYETKEGRAALTRLFHNIVESDDPQVPHLPNPKETLRDMGLLIRDEDGTEIVKTEDQDNIPRFLNRVLALDVARQNAIFDYFVSLFEAAVAEAKRNGTLDLGVADVRALSVRVAAPPELVHVERLTGARTIHYTMEFDWPARNVTWEQALEIHDGGRAAFYQSKATGKYILAVESGRQTDAARGSVGRTYAVTAPQGQRVHYLNQRDLTDKYRPVRPEAARDWWIIYEATLPEIETETAHIIGGAILPLWERMASKEGGSLYVIRVTTDDRQRIVGIEIPSYRIASVLSVLGIQHNYEDTPAIFRAVRDDGVRIELLNDLGLKQSRLHRQLMIEVVGAHPSRFQELRRLDLHEENIRGKARFFVPTDPDTGVEILGRLLERYPPTRKEEEKEERPAIDLTPHIFDLDSLVENPTATDPMPDAGAFTLDGYKGEDGACAAGEGVSFASDRKPPQEDGVTAASSADAEDETEARPGPDAESPQFGATVRAAAAAKRRGGKGSRTIESSNPSSQMGFGF